MSRERCFSLIRSMGQRKIPSSHEESNLRPWDSALQCSTTEPQRFDGEEGPLQSSLMTRLAYCYD